MGVREVSIYELLSPLLIIARSTKLGFKSVCLLLLSGKNKLKALYPFTHRCCSRFTYSGAWFSVSNCKHYIKCAYIDKESPIITR